MLQLPMTFVSWKEAFEYARSNSDLLAALVDFREWLKPGWQDWHAKAPLACQFFGAFQGNVPEGVRLHQIVCMLQAHGVRGLDLHVRKSLGAAAGKTAWSQYCAGVMGLEFAEIHVAAGRGFEFIRNTSDPSPDAVMSLGDRAITVEFKGLHQSDGRNDWYEFLQKILDRITKEAIGLEELDLELTVGAQAHPDEVADHLVAIYRVGSGDWKELPRGFGRARRSHSNEGLVNVPLVEKNDAARISLKLRAWSKQLRRCNGPAILVVRASQLFRFSGEDEVLGAAERLWTTIRPNLEAQTSVSAFVIYDRPFLPPAPALFRDMGDFRVATGQRNGFAFGAVLIPNRRARSPLTPSELEVLLNPQSVY